MNRRRLYYAIIIIVSIALLAAACVGEGNTTNATPTPTLETGCWFYEGGGVCVYGTDFPAPTPLPTELWPTSPPPTATPTPPPVTLPPPATPEVSP
jgi:hypothetical protein